jgi:protein-disulfide isomerase
VEHEPASPAPSRTIAATTEGGAPASLSISEGDAWKGNPQAAVTLVEFADFQCGYCRNVSTELSRVFETYGDRVLFVFKHYPLDPACNPGVQNLKHAIGCIAARAGVCAREQGRFWAFHDLVYANQRELSAQTLRTHAEHLGLDLAKLDACIEDSRSLDAVRRDGQLGKALELHGTPRILINGTLYRGGRTAAAIGQTLGRALAGQAP